MEQSTSQERTASLEPTVQEQSYPVEDVCPSLHGDALKNCQHGEENVVKVGDPAVGTFPLSPALRAVGDTEAPAPGERAGGRVILHHEACSSRSAGEGSLLHQTPNRNQSGAETCAGVVAALVHPADEELQADDGVDYDDKHDQHADVQQGDHGFHDGVQHNLQTWQSRALSSQRGDQQETIINENHTWHSRNETQRSQHPERSEGFHVQTSRLPRSVMGLSRFMVCHALCHHAEQAAQTNKTDGFIMFFIQT